MIALSIVSHGQGAIAGALLDCIIGDDTGLISQVIYTRNLPQDDGVEKRTGLPGREIIDNPRPKGFGANHNAAYQRCRAPWFCIMNPDISWKTSPFPALLSCAGNDYSLVAPAIVDAMGRPQNTARRLYTPGELLRQKWRPLNAGDGADWLAGMFLLFRSDRYRSIGGFDERYFLYIEDVDICTRLRLAGHRLKQCPEASITHDARKTSHRSFRYSIWHIQGMLRYWASPSFWRYRSLLSRERRDAIER